MHPVNLGHWRENYFNLKLILTISCIWSTEAIITVSKLILDVKMAQIMEYLKYCLYFSHVVCSISKIFIIIEWDRSGQEQSLCLGNKWWITRAIVRNSYYFGWIKKWWIMRPLVQNTQYDFRNKGWIMRAGFRKHHYVLRNKRWITVAIVRNSQYVLEQNCNT